MRKYAPLFYYRARNHFETVINAFHQNKKLIRKLKNLGISYSKYIELKNHPIYYSTTVPFLGRNLTINSPHWFLEGVKEIFLSEYYAFMSNKRNPYIIDCGSNIGLSLIYFKRLYPASRILAFEADPLIFNSLSANVTEYSFCDIDLRNNAVWINDNDVSFSVENSVGGKIVDSNASSTSINVKGVRLNNFLQQEVDFLKIDIEGAEVDVLLDCYENLSNVKHIFVEYHSSTLKSQRLDELLHLLADSGFRYYLKEAWEYTSRPFVDWPIGGPFDMQLNIFATRID